MKMIIFVLTLMALLVPWVLQAQDQITVSVGAGNVQSPICPSNCYYNYSLSEMIYTAGEVGIDGEINSIAFYAMSGGSRIWTLYMAELDKSSFASTGDFVADSNFHQVYSGPVVLTEGWNTITLDSTFYYQDTANLVIAAVDVTGSYESDYVFFMGYVADQMQSLSFYHDDCIIPLAAPAANESGVNAFLPNIQLGMLTNSVYCVAPGNLNVSGLAEGSATLSWHENGGSSAWQVLLSDSVVTDFNAQTPLTFYDTTCTLMGLSGSTVYYAYVRTDCGSAYSDWAGPLVFRSACIGYATVPYTTSFEDVVFGELPDCWANYATGASANGISPHVFEDSLNSRTGRSHLRLESMLGETEVTALPEFLEPNTLQVEFYAATTHSACPSRFEVGVMEDSVFVPVDTVNLTDSYAFSYFPYTVYLTTYGGGGTRPAFRVMGSHYTVNIDDITISTAPTCVPAANPIASNPTSHSIDLGWHAVDNEVSWNVIYDTLPIVNFGGYNPEIVTGNHATITGLDTNRTYYFYVQTDCGGGDTSIWAGPVIARTTFECGDGLDAIHGQVGEAPQTTSSLPVCNGWGSSYSQQIFTPDELSDANIYTGYLRNLSIEWKSTNGNTPKHLSIYMATTPQSEFANSTAWVDDSLFTLVWSDSNNVHPLGWVQYDFDQPFYYDGTSNLVVAFLSNHNGTDSTSNTANATYHTTTANRSILKYANNAILSPDSVTGAAANLVSDIRNNIKLGACVQLPDCPMPRRLSLVGVDSSSVSLSWIAAGGVTQWDIYYDTAAMDSLQSGTIMQASTNPATVSNLQGGVRYYFYVRTRCGDTTTAWTGPVTAIPNSWTMRPNQTDTLHMCGGVIYDDGGSAGNYSASQESCLVLYPSDSTQGVRLSGELRVVNSHSDYLVIYDGAGTTGTVIFSSQGANVPLGSPIAVGCTSLSGAATIYFHSQGLSQSAGYELFEQCYDRSCPAVEHLTADIVEENAITLSWHESGAAESWNVQYDSSPFLYGDTTGTLLTTSDTAITITGLTGNTRYYFAVVADCGSAASMASYLDVRTACPATATIPYIEGFEDYAQESTPACWQVIQSTDINGDTMPAVKEGYNYSHTGLKSYVFAGSTPSIVALPLFQDVNTLQMEFSMLDYSDEIPVVEIGVIEGDTTFVPVDTVALIGDFGYHDYIVFLSPYTGVGERPAIRITGTDYYVALDDVTISEIPSCFPVTHLDVAATTVSSVTLAWDADGSVAWNVTYDTAAITDFTTHVLLPCTTNPCTVTGLTTGQPCYFYVQADCGNGDYSAWVGPILATPGVFNMHANRTDTLHLCGGTIYDDGGIDGNYSSQQTSTIVLMPDSPMMGVVVSGTSHTESIYDYLAIYDGIGTNGRRIWSDYGQNQPVEFGPIASTTGPLTLMFISNQALNYDGFEINVSCISMSCPKASNIHTETATGNSIVVAWTDNTDGATWEIEYGELGFAQGTGTTIATTDNPCTLTGLLPTTGYGFYIRPVCGEGDTGEWAFAPISTAYCSDKDTIDAFDMNLEAASTNTAPFNTYYKYSYSQTLLHAADLAGLSRLVELSFYANNANGGGSMNDCEIYVGHTDKTTFANNNDWLAPDDLTLVYSGDLSYSQGWNTFELDVPFAYDGQSNLVVAVLRNSGTYGTTGSYGIRKTPGAPRCIYTRRDINPFDMASPGNGTRGQYYPEFSFLSCNASGCTKPGNVGVNVESYNQATISWSGDGSNYDVAVRSATDAAWPDPTPVSGNTYAFTNLMPSTQYTARVRQNCGADVGASAWVMVTFTTDSLYCLAPDNLEIVSTSNNGVTVDWDAFVAQDTWVVRIFNTIYDHEYTVSSHPATLNGLSTDNTYNVTVSGMCSGVMQSEWSDTIQFTTVECGHVSNVSATVAGSTATISWVSGPDNVSWQLIYGEVGEVSSSDIPLNVTANPCTIANLANGDYEVYVQAVCGPGWYSGWSEQAHTTFTVTEGVGIGAAQAPSHISLHPNPTTGTATLLLQGVQGDIHVDVVDMQGRILQTTSMECSGDCMKKLDVRGLAQGTYFVRIYGSQTLAVRRLIVR